MRNLRNWLPVALSVAALSVAVGCSNPEAPSSDAGSSNGSGNGNNSGTTVNGQTVALTIDGAAFQPTTVIASIDPAIGSKPETLGIYASSPGSGSTPAQVVRIMSPSRVGIYDFRSTPNMLVRFERGQFGSEQWWEALSGSFDSGTVEITSRTSNAIEGRVNVKMGAAGTGAGATSKTCVGTFSVRF